MTTYPKSGDLQRKLASSLTANPGGRRRRAKLYWDAQDKHAQGWWLKYETARGGEDGEPIVVSDDAAEAALDLAALTLPAGHYTLTQYARGGDDVIAKVEVIDNDVVVGNPGRRGKPGGEPMNGEGMTWLEWARAAHIPAPLTPTLHRAAHRDWEQGVDPTEWRAHIERHGYPHVNPARSNPPVRSIHDGMERALWVCAFADWVEEQGPSARRKYGAHNGAKWHDVAPDAPDEAADAGKELAEMFRRANGKDLLMLLGLAAKADGVKATDTYAESFGHYMAMQALGHGVSWFDDHAQFPITFPRFECHCPDGMSLEWSPRKLATQNPGPKEWHPPPGATVEFTVYEIDDTASSGPRRAFVGKYVDLKSAKAEAKRYAGGYPREVVDIRGKVVYRDDAQARRGRR